jgi:hypothetical protein
MALPLPRDGSLHGAFSQIGWFQQAIELAKSPNDQGAPNDISVIGRRPVPALGPVSLIRRRAA